MFTLVITLNDTMKLTISDFELGSVLADLTDSQRMYVLRKLIWTAPDMHDFYAKAVKELNSERFKDTMD